MRQVGRAPRRRGSHDAGRYSCGAQFFLCPGRSLGRHLRVAAGQGRASGCAERSRSPIVSGWSHRIRTDAAAATAVSEHSRRQQQRSVCHVGTSAAIRRRVGKPVCEPRRRRAHQQSERSGRLACGVCASSATSTVSRMTSRSALPRLWRPGHGSSNDSEADSDAVLDTRFGPMRALRSMTVIRHRGVRPVRRVLSLHRGRSGRDRRVSRAHA